jgi:hypothetical protein
VVLFILSTRLRDVHVRGISGAMTAEQHVSFRIRIAEKERGQQQQQQQHVEPRGYELWTTLPPCLRSATTPDHLESQTGCATLELLPRIAHDCRRKLYDGLLAMSRTTPPFEQPQYSMSLPLRPPAQAYFRKEIWLFTWLSA